ncbi:MAG: DUF5683 domain-containing protein [Bacteroidota bacterium]|nr:DUF5683 domain-containing protein [Bacteroidota bacterium]
MKRSRAMGVALTVFVALSAHPIPAEGQEKSRDTVVAERRTESFIMSKSPWGAALRSAVFPGFGQFYNESYWKIPIVLGLGAFLVRGVIVENADYVAYRDRYAASITPTNPAGDLRLKQFREYYRNNRDTYAWWFLVLYLVQIADAYVDAHLFDFSVSNDLAGASPLMPGMTLTLSLRF